MWRTPRQHSASASRPLVARVGGVLVVPALLLTACTTFSVEQQPEPEPSAEPSLAVDAEDLARLGKAFDKARRERRQLMRPQRQGISWAQAPVGYRGYVCGPVASAVEDGTTVFLNIGKPYPEPDRLTVVGWQAVFDGPMAQILEGKQVCAKGTVVDFRGVRQIQMQSFAGRVTRVQ